MRFFCVLFLLIISIIEIGPVPISPLFFIWIVLFRPEWFYELVQKIYRKN
ncbi:MAG: hypothetical protein RIQ94_1734 [Pseudomonadota bacterium]|jgi:hypothetical protein